MKRKALAVLGLMMGAGCSPLGRLEPDYDVAGTVLEVEPEGRRLTVQVHSGVGASMAVFNVMGGTRIELVESGRRRRVELEDVRAGDEIAAKTEGAELRSLPPQYSVSAIRVSRRQAG